MQNSNPFNTNNTSHSSPNNFFDLPTFGKRNYNSFQNTISSKSFPEEIIIEDDDKTPQVYSAKQVKIDPELKQEASLTTKGNERMNTMTTMATMNTMKTMRTDTGNWSTKRGDTKEILIEEEGSNEEGAPSQETVLLEQDTVLLDEQTFLTIEDGKSEDDFIEEVGAIEEEPKGTEVKTEDVEPFTSPIDDSRPTFWLNKLKFYPSYASFDNTISFRELLFEDLLVGNPEYPTRTLQSAFMTTYGFDFALFESMLKAGVKLTLLDDWNDPNEPKVERNVNGYANCTLIRPNKDLTRPYYGVFHPKLWLLKFPKFLRIVIGSGNLCLPQWVNWSNCLWFRDFPLRSVAEGKPKETTSVSVNNQRFDLDKDFVRTLEDFIIKIIPKWINHNDLLGFSFDEYYITGIDVVMIPSIPGRHYEKDFDKYGHRKIAYALRKTIKPKHFRQNNKKWVLTYQATSLSSLDEKFLLELASSFLPDFCTIEALRANKITQKEGSSPLYEVLKDRIKVIYPTKDYVENSKDGPLHARPLKLTPEGYLKKGFPKDMLYQYEAPVEGDFHTGIIPHLKVFIITDESGEIDDDTIIYFGSHNLSSGAWGRYERDYTQISIGNTELGVLVPSRRGSKAQKEKIIKGLSFKFPPRPYGKDDVPWISKAHLNKEAYL